MARVNSDETERLALPLGREHHPAMPWRRPAPGTPPGLRRHAQTQAVEDLIVIAVVGAVLFALSTAVDLFDALAVWLHTRQLVDEVVTVTLLVTGGVAVFAWRRWRELGAAHREIRILSGVIPLCAWCRRARNAEGTWIPLEDYVERQSEAAVSPDVCPECVRRIPGARARRGFF